ncbi:MAG: hypothetical protein AAEJ52_23340 [Myxococcota bacterium]
MSRRRLSMRACALVAVAVATGSIGAWGTAAAQSVRAQSPGGPHYPGNPVQIQITADGFEEEPTPTIEPPEAGSAAWRLVYRGVAPSVRSSISIVGGQIRRSKEVKFVFSYELWVDRPGGVSVGSFVVSQGSTRKTTRPLEFDFRNVPTTGRIQVELELPDAPVYLGERVPITLRFRLVGSIRENLHRYTLRVPLFDLTNSFRFLDPPGVAETDIKIQTAAGELNLKADTQVSTSGGEQVLTVSIHRVAVPLRDGPVSIPATILDVEEGTQFRRDLFGGRKATRVRKWRATDRRRRFVVKRIPANRTPPSFAGAVGAGFSLRVSADRTVVQVGEPIALAFELRGDGNLESASLPPLDAPGLLPRTQFRVPEGELAGRLEDGTKHFTAMVRVADPSVSEIPALEYSWFDPTSETFHSTQSRPIALSVRDAQVIGAAQVEREPSDADGDDGGTQTAAPEGPRAEPRRSAPGGRLALTGADLAIERDPARLARVASDRSGGIWGVAGLYLGTMLLIGVAQLDRHRRDIDPQITARRRRMNEQLGLVRAAAALPSAEAAGALASALRALVAESPQANSAEVDAFVGECDARSYAPRSQSSAAPLDPEFQERARQLAERIAESAS